MSQAAVLEQVKDSDTRKHVAHAFNKFDIMQYELGNINKMVAFCGFVLEGKALRAKAMDRLCCEICLDIAVARGSQELQGL